MTSLDPRRHAFRADLAEKDLEGQVAATRFVEGVPRQVVAPTVTLRRRPEPDAPLETEALFGEAVVVFEEEAGWSWVKLAPDSPASAYVGYMPTGALGPSTTPTHRVCVPRTLVFPAPDIKRPPLSFLPMGALVTVTGAAADQNARYSAVTPDGFIVEQHLEPLAAVAPDFVAVAERFLGAPYLWGGKSVAGIDCSGLVQLACAMAGIAAPRDTDMQERELGTRLAGIEALERGDLVFWKGHVGIMLDGARLLHANAHHMMTAVEPLAEAVARIASRGSSVTSIRRIRPLTSAQGDGPEIVT
ncbi:MAG: C40 family peptidase [Aurantimonas endophytica]|uniref:Cell wall-associated NlpC family hydrolase n=1 Tax=Aurantimonas endophytica TaxID=1522175 RepID=A0A7W6MPB2_9HYPH|nr:C40 family peptidase [Aurantimonas endophytica]MBB4002687.1 cell wall-associated NlpC family hydrolase [Aurantimonas endophytica]MCO6403567.1 peptidase P60 [Aurantimonas endophytica]